MDQLIEIGIGRCDESDVHIQFLITAQRLNLAHGDGPQQGLLDLGRGGLNLVQKQDSAVGLQKSPFAVGLSVRIGPLDMTEQGVQEEAFIQLAAIDRDERSLGTSGNPVNGLGCQLLARPGFTDDQDVRIHLPGFAKVPFQLRH